MLAVYANPFEYSAGVSLQRLIKMRAASSRPKYHEKYS
jgi:hypothetical protein